MARSKIISAITLLLIYTFSATATVELLKVPLLAKHFRDHQSEKKHTGLFTFLVQHYIYENGTDQDASEDSQLPFKSTDHLATLAFNCLTPPSFIQVPAKDHTGMNTCFYIQDFDFPVPGYLSAIWQPPRNC